MPFTKGQPRTPGSGRKPGSQNLTSQKLKEIVFEALKQQEGGAIGYLKAQAIAEPRAFMALIGKLLPTQITGEDGAPVRITQIELIPLVAPAKNDDEAAD
ncbi:MAG: hypothetical protein JNK99_01445 [Candidatus Accumulibacter sp.]|uniref:hypothetical protein n=1 Tax=Accumulibacter sp. TaxID=2053492 RepID=UPI001A584B37|nr:hypothetical protein [Accumulibacter sp.]MBL8393403.1 hypothetical protein [Accumulibacter sp.]